jgi:hypothetical protein
MILKILLKSILTIIFIIINTFNVNRFEINYIKYSFPQMTLLYNNIWGTIYHAEERECDSSPTITGDGSKIDINNASNQRWMAITQDMLNLPKGLKMFKDTSKVNIFKGKITYGDTVWVDSPNPEINGWWVVHDAKNARVKYSVDFLQTKGDTKLYKGDKLWCGKFYNIKIYKLLNNKNYSTFKNK